MKHCEICSDWTCELHNCSYAFLILNCMSIRPKVYTCNPLISKSSISSIPSVYALHVLASTWQCPDQHGRFWIGRVLGLANHLEKISPCAFLKEWCLPVPEHSCKNQNLPDIFASILLYWLYLSREPRYRALVILECLDLSLCSSCMSN